jgi:cephalosporin-C deacetylase-like acetyl esterase
MSEITRRSLLRIAVAGPGLGLLPFRAQAAEAESYLAKSPDMLVDYLSSRLNALAGKWDRERDQIRTPDAMTARNRFVREKFREMIGGLPERSPLTPVVVRAHERPGYRVENVMYQSRPDFWVTGNLYIPEGKGPFPAIVSPCGHYPLARMYPDYQAAYVNLVRAGFVVLGYDPIGQGERRQYWDSYTGASDITDSVYEHSLPGHVLLLLGENLTQYRAWDGIRGIDYLSTRPEVDKDRIGCAGHSGGSTLTLFITLLDDRVKCAVMNESSTNHAWPVHVARWARIPAPDAEQNIFPAATYGMDRCDMNAAIAPRPLLTTIEEYTPKFTGPADHIRARYKLLGVEEKFATQEATDPHAWTMKLRQATTDWFSRWFYGRKGPAQEADFEPERPETLYCTPNGSIRESHQGDTIFSLMLKKHATLPERTAPAGAEEIAKVLRFRRAEAPLGVRHIVTTPRRGYQIEKVEFVSEPGIYIPAWIYVPEHRTSRGATLIADDRGIEAECLELGLYETLARKGRLTVAVDVRGMGQTAPPHKQEAFGAESYRQVFGVETALSYMSWQLDDCLFGMRVLDIVRSVDYVLNRGDVDASDVRVCGKGAGALWALFAGALDKRISGVVAEGGLVSYGTLTETDRYTHETGIFVRGVLQHFDLPQVAAAIAPRPLTLVAPVDAMKRPLPEGQVREAYRFAADTYGKAGKAGLFRITSQGDAAVYTG